MSNVHRLAPHKRPARQIWVISFTDRQAFAAIGVAITYAATLWFFFWLGQQYG